MVGKKEVRILLVGDPGVGKTSLILTLVCEEFPDEVPAKAEEITIANEVTPEQVPTHIVDYSSQEQDEECLQDEIIKADVVCVVYSVEDEDTVERITTHWLPYLRSKLGDDHKVPVILIGNKSDLLQDSDNEETMRAIMNEFSEVETCVECSARTLKNITEIFYYAQKAVLHPTAAVYNPQEKELTQQCKSALTRIFKIADLDNDGILNDDEVHLFQRRCYNAPLHQQQLEDVKAIVKRNISDGIVDNGIALKGFLFLHTLFIQRGRHETTWTVLRAFGYDDDLKLTREHLSPELQVGRGSTTELSNQGQQFLRMIFQKYDEDNDGCLSPPELQNLFSTCPVMPWGPDVANTVCTNPNGWITMQGFTAQFVLRTWLDVPWTIEYLGYLGYRYLHDSQLSAITVTRDKKIDLEKKQTSRNVFRCHVLGAKGVGKTSLLQGHLNRNLRYVATLVKEHLSNFTINTVQVYGQEKYLLLQEVDVAVCDMLNFTEMNCDVACLVYDVTNPRSFDFCARMYLKHFRDSRIPTLVVACKTEYPSVRQDYELSPLQFCNKFKLPPPQSFTCMDKVNKEVYVKLATMAAYPHARELILQDDKIYIKVGVGVAVVASLSFLLYKLYRALR